MVWLPCTINHHFYFWRDRENVMSRRQCSITTLYNENNYLKDKAAASHSVPPAEMERKSGCPTVITYSGIWPTKLISFVTNLCHRAFMWSAPWQLYSLCLEDSFHTNTAEGPDFYIQWDCEMECTYCMSAAKYFWKIVFLLPTNQLQSLGVARVYLQMEQSAKYSISIRRFTHTLPKAQSLIIFILMFSNLLEHKIIFFS